MSDRQTTGIGPWLQSQENELDTVSGASTTVQTWEGSETECRTKYSAMQTAGATRLKLAPKGDGNWLVRGSFPFDTEGINSSYVDVYELEVNAIQRSVYQSPIYRSKFDDFDAVTQYSTKANATLGIIADCARKYQSGQPKRETTGYYLFDGTAYSSREEAVENELGTRFSALASATPAVVLTPDEILAGLRLFRNIAYRGVNSFIEYNHVFRRRVTAGSSTAIQANSVGGGKIWTSAEVIAWEGVPSFPTVGWFELPPDVQWHKDKPRVIAAYGQKTEISYSYTEVVTATALLYEAYRDAVLIDV